MNLMGRFLGAQVGSASCLLHVHDVLGSEVGWAYFLTGLDDWTDWLEGIPAWPLPLQPAASRPA